MKHGTRRRGPIPVMFALIMSACVLPVPAVLETSDTMRYDHSDN